jgi:hypothetical protein
VGFEAMLAQRNVIVNDEISGIREEFMWCGGSLGMTSSWFGKIKLEPLLNFEVKEKKFGR